MRILHLYHDLMSLYGEYGNVVVIKRELEKQGIEVDLDRKSLEEDIDFSSYDLVYCGCGKESDLEAAREDLIKRKDDILSSLSDTAYLFTGNAMELFGASIDDKEALGIFSFTTVHETERSVGDVIMNWGENKVVGFINKNSYTEGEEEAKWFDYYYKAENQDAHIHDNSYEGYHRGNIYLTHLIGPLLVKNPLIREEIAKHLMQKKGLVYRSCKDEIAQKSYEVTLQALISRKQEG